MQRKRVTKMFVARRSLGVSQEELAARIGVTQPRISSWENGLVPIPPARRDDLSRELGVPVDDLDLDAVPSA